ncbi:MAG: PTS sugar transporter subunit IIA [Sedimentisphaerales bacterium]|nr:PTS sugar transporter subunit IIA [Sedimentisphaerales bacterium]
MPYRSMTVKELAQMMGADARRLERMAERGEVPCQKVSGQLRFNRAEITEWLQQNIATMDRGDLAEVDAGIGADRQHQQDEALISPLLRPGAVAVQLKSRGKHSLLRELVGLANDTGRVYDEQTLLEAVLAREEMCSTAIEGGIAIPHPRRPLPYELADAVLVVGRTGRGIVFGAPDGRLTDLFFLIASQDDRHHLHMLARLCRMLHDETFLQQLREAEHPEEMMNAFKQREQAVLAQCS